MIGTNMPPQPRSHADLCAGPDHISKSQLSVLNLVLAVADRLHQMSSLGTPQIHTQTT